MSCCYCHIATSTSRRLRRYVWLYWTNDGRHFNAFTGINEASESEEESEEEKQNDEEAKEDEEEEEGKKTPVQLEKKKKKGTDHVKAEGCSFHWVHTCQKNTSSIPWHTLLLGLSIMDVCVTDSSGESDSSDDSDIEGETASALFMVISVCVCVCVCSCHWVNGYFWMLKALSQSQ